MKKIVITSGEPSDARVLGDILRVYYPGSVTQYLPLEGVIQENAEDSTIRIWIEENRNPCGFQVKLLADGQYYQGQSQDSGFYLGENQHNRRRRLLRLSVHRALLPHLRQQGLLVSPWGILTGVRPTKVVHRLLRQNLTMPEIIRVLQEEYGLQQDKAQLVTIIAIRQQPILSGLKQSDAVSIYLSIPFCPTRCHYCSFPAFAMGRWGSMLESYLTSLAAEIRGVALALRDRDLRVQCVYVGGGTPTVLSAEQLARLLSMIQENFPLSEEAEITVEAGRPDTLDRPKLEALRNGGVNRISINPQTLHDTTLQAIGREHTAQEIIEAYALARAVGFQNINMDLIIGLPRENSGLLAETLQQVIDLKPENITLHALALKRAATFKQEGVSELPDSREGALLTVQAQQTLESAGYQAYYLYRQKEIVGHGENVGYCLPGNASLYNIFMMEEEQTILGLGVGSSSKFIDPQTNSIDNLFNPKDLFVYQERLPQLIEQKVDKVKSFG